MRITVGFGGLNSPPPPPPMEVKTKGRSETYYNASVTTKGKITSQLAHISTWHQMVTEIGPEVVTIETGCRFSGFCQDQYCMLFKTQIGTIMDIKIALTSF